MKLLKVQTTRFVTVVEKCGRPSSYTLWQKPKNDPALEKLITKNRMMTIRRGAGAEFGEVGFYKAERVIYLGFPRSLKSFEGDRIIGIKWDLVGNK